MSTFRGSPGNETPKKTTQFPLFLTSHERILIFMIVEKDASTPNDKRHVKNKSNVNLLTRKKTGGKCIMGNQGMTNWKFSVFLVIALTLVAGLFADTALAGKGDGTMEVTIGAATYVHSALDSADDAEIVLQAKSTAILTFVYMADGEDGPINMNGGRVRLDIPADWKFGIDDIQSITDGTETDKLYLAGARLTDDTDVLTAAANGIRGPASKDNRDKRRVYLTLDGVNVTRIEVDLDEFAWRVDRTAGRALTITLGTTDDGIDVPIPAGLEYDDGIPYENYEFTTLSAAATGKYGRLTRPDGTPVGTQAQPEIKVGNIDSDAALAVTQHSPAKMYVGEKANFVIRLTANGPIYDVNTDNAGDPEINAQIVIDLSESTGNLKILPDKLPKVDLDSNPATPNEAPDPPPAITGAHVTQLDNTTTNIASPGQVKSRPANMPGYYNVKAPGVGYKATISEGTDSEGDPNGISTDSTVTIDIEHMDTGDYVELTYTRVWAAAAGDDLISVVVTSDDAASEAVTVGEVLARGGGTVEISYNAAHINASKPTTEITYTADTALEDAYLFVQIPDGVFTMPTLDDDTQFVALTLTDGKNGGFPREGDDESSPAGEVEIVSKPTNVDLTLLVSSGNEDSDTDYTDYNIIRWGPLSFSRAGATSKARIKNVRITGDTGVYPWTAYIRIATRNAENDAIIEASIGVPTGEADFDPNLCALQAEANPTDPDVAFEIESASALPLSSAGHIGSIITESGGFDAYDAAGRYRITFKFTAVRTPLKQGSLLIELPSNWSNFSKDPGTLGYTTWTRSEGTGLGEGKGYGSLKFTITKLDLDIGQSVSITYGVNAGPVDAVIDDMVGAFAQPDAGDVVIKSRFDVDPSGGIADQASNEINITVGNVAAGSGTATIRGDTVEAGSIVSLTVAFVAQGTMDGGRVALQMPDNWGDLQQDDAAADNYVKVTNVGGTLGDWDTNDDIVEANLATFNKGNTVRFALENVVAQPSNLGVVNFTIYSAGTDGEDLDIVVGQAPPDGAYTNAGANLEMLLGRVYRTDCIDDDTDPGPDDYNGFLRIAVTGGGDGGGTATFEIVASQSGDEDYEVDGETIKMLQLHAGDAEKSANIRFTYTPIESIITDGELKFTVPSGWNNPQTDSPSTAGFTVVSSSGGTRLPPVPDGNSITVPLVLITRDNPITIDYGAESGGVTPPTSVGPETFTIQIKGSADPGSRLKPIARQPIVYIRPQATGRGTASVAASGTLYAGSTGNSVTITYTSVGQVVDGDLKITVPENWSPATSDHFDISGSVVYGGELTDDERAEDDPVDNHISDDAVGLRELIISGIDLSASGSYSVTYKDVTVQPASAEGVGFKIEFRGNAGPGTGFGAVTHPEGEDKAQLVNVLDVEPGSGTVEVKGPAVTTVGLTAYDITIIYTADAQISADKVIAVQIPAGWSDPIDDDQEIDDDGDYNVGTYTVMHKQADGTYFTDRYGDNTNGNVEKADVADRMLMATVTGDGVKAGETVIFTFQNATAPAAAGPSEFQVYYDGAKVESDDDVVNVQSAAGAEMLALSSEEASFLIDDGGSLTVTVMLQAADGSAATRAVDTTVTLVSSSDDGSFDPATVTIPAGDTMGTSDYSDGKVGSVEITASTDATGIAAADALPIVANTENPMLESVDFSPKVAKDLDTITVTATGTAFQNPTFLIETINVSGISMTDDADDGMYTGTHRLARGSAEGEHSVTVSIGDVSLAADDMLTVDNTAPVITAEIDMSVVMTGDEATISATLSEAATVTADVTALNAAAPMLTLTDADGEGEGMVYEGKVMVTAEGDVADIAIEITAEDAAGNTGMASVTVTIDGTAPVITAEIDMSVVMTGGEATISATLSEAATVTADVTALNAAAPMLTLTDADGDMVYEGAVMITAEGDVADITIEITAADAAGNTGMASVMVTLDNTVPVIMAEDMLSVMTGGEATISATLSKAATVTADVTALNAAAPTLSLMDADGDMVYEGTVMVTAEGDVADIAIAITAADAAGNTGTASVTVTLDNTDPVITAEIDMPSVMMGGEVTISAMVSEASTVSADVTALNAAAPTLSLMDADGSGMYSGSVMVTAEGDVADIAIEITAADAAGNTGTASVMVTLDNTPPEVTGESIDMSSVMAGDEVTISAMVSGASTVSADVSMLNAAAPTLSLMDADGSGMYSGSVMVTTADPAADGEVTITITASDAAGNAAPATVMVTLDNTMPEVTAVSPDPMDAKNGDTVMISAMVSEASTVTADVSMLDTMQTEMVTLTDADGGGTYTGSFTISMNNTAEDGSHEVTVTAVDDAGNSGTNSAMVNLDNTVPEVTAVSGSPSPARNGHEVTISAAVSEAATVTADVSMLDTMQTEMVTLTDADGDGTYTGSFTISEENEADNGSREVTVMATDAAGNSGTAAGSVDLINTLDYTSMIPQGISLFHVPLDVTAIDGSEASLSMVSDLYKALGDAVNYIISTEDGVIWNSYLGGTSGDAAITADRGLVVVMSDAKEIKFTGNAWGEDMGPGAGEGASMITLRSGLNLVGLPVNDVSVSKVSDIMNLPEFAGKVTSIIVSTDDGKFASATAGGADDGDVRGDAAYLVFSSELATQPVMGEGWSNGEMAGAAPIALFGHKVDNQTAALFVEGSLVDELTGLAREGFRIKVKNLSTKAALNTISQGDVAQGGYNMTFVDTKAGNAARIGDVLEISADSPNPLIGVKPVRHIVTIDDVKNSRIQLEDLIAYEIPAETELLRNYPNPFNPETWIPYRLAEDTDVLLTIYNVNGEMVRDIDVGHQTAAVYESRAKAIYWDGRNRFGEQVASGIYFYHLSAGDFSATRKMVILK